jgi:hypothetical protein
MRNKGILIVDSTLFHVELDKPPTYNVASELVNDTDYVVDVDNSKWENLLNVSGDLPINYSFDEVILILGTSFYKLSEVKINKNVISFKYCILLDDFNLINENNNKFNIIQTIGVDYSNQSYSDILLEARKLKERIQNDINDEGLSDYFNVIVEIKNKVNNIKF